MTRDKEFYQALPFAVVGGVEGVYRYYARPFIRENIGAIATGLLCATAGAYDVLAPDGHTISESFRRQPLALQVGELAILSAHLLDILPKQIDPFHQALKAVKK